MRRVKASRNATRFMLAALLASAHTFHSSIAQLDFITSKKTIEVIVWLHTEDIERAFKDQNGRNANFDQPAAAERFVSEYLRKHFEVRNSAGKVLPQKWVGLEVKVHFVAAYFEIAASDVGGLTLTNKVLLDRVPDQVNSVQVKQDGKAIREFNAAGLMPLVFR